MVSTHCAHNFSLETKYEEEGHATKILLIRLCLHSHYIIINIYAQRNIHDIAETLMIIRLNNIFCSLSVKISCNFNVVSIIFHSNKFLTVVVLIKNYAHDCFFPQPANLMMIIIVGR